MKLKSLLATAALACAVAGGAAQAEVLRWAAQNDILTLDPHSQNVGTVSMVLRGKGRISPATADFIAPFDAVTLALSAIVPFLSRISQNTSRVPLASSRVNR